MIPAGREWIDQQWLAQLVFYGLERAGGLGLALLFHAVMVSAALGVTMIASRVRGASVRMTLVATVVCLAVAPWSWQLRAQSIALPLFAVTLALTATDHRLAKRRTLLVFPLLVLWANVHGSVVLGAALVSLAGLVTFAGRRVRGLDPRPADWGGRSSTSSCPGPAPSPRPTGPAWSGYYRTILVDSPVSRYITEWRAPSPHGYQLVFFAVAAATVAIAVWQRRRLAVYDLAVLAITLAGALRSVRAVVWFALALALLLPLALDGITGPPPEAQVHRRAAGGAARHLCGARGLRRRCDACPRRCVVRARLAERLDSPRARRPPEATRSGRAAPTRTGCCGRSRACGGALRGTRASSC